MCWLRSLPTRPRYAEGVGQGWAGTAKAAGKTWGESKKGRLVKMADEQAMAIIHMNAEGEKVARITRIRTISHTIQLNLAIRSVLETASRLVPFTDYSISGFLAFPIGPDQ